MGVGAPRGDLVAVPRLHGAQARARCADLDDLLLIWRALAADEVIGPRLAASFDHVLIDEYQDVNGLQVDLARSLGVFGPTSPRSATTSRRSTASAPPRPRTSSTSPSISRARGW